MLFSVLKTIIVIETFSILQRKFKYYTLYIVEYINTTPLTLNFNYEINHPEIVCFTAMFFVCLFFIQMLVLR